MSTLKIIDEARFRELLADAIDHIPKQYQEKMKNVAILVEDWPTPEQKQRIHLHPHSALFGLYEGVPLTKRGGATHTMQPDVITIFRYPMIHMYPDETSLREQIYETLWHEVAHYFGLNHSQIHAKKMH